MHSDGLLLGPVEPLMSCQQTERSQGFQPHLQCTPEGKCAMLSQSSHDVVASTLFFGLQKQQGSHYLPQPARGCYDFTETLSVGIQSKIMLTSCKSRNAVQMRNAEMVQSTLTCQYCSANVHRACRLACVVENRQVAVRRTRRLLPQHNL